METGFRVPFFERASTRRDRGEDVVVLAVEAPPTPSRNSCHPFVGTILPVGQIDLPAEEEI